MARASQRTLALFSLFLLSCASLCAGHYRQETTVHKSLNSIRECLSNRFPVVCFKERALDFLNATITSDKPMRFFNMVEIARNPKYILNNTEVEELPEDVLKRSVRLNDVLKDKVEEYFRSRTIKFDMEPVGEEDDHQPDETDEARQILQNGKYFYEGNGDNGGYEGKKKKCRGKGGGGGGGGGKKGGGYMMMGMIGMGCMMAQMMMGKVAFMAGTALIVAKIALFLSAIIGLKKLSSGGGGGGGETSAHVIYATDHGHGGGGGGGGGGWHRSIDGQAAQTMAYRAYGDSVGGY